MRRAIALTILIVMIFSLVIPSFAAESYSISMSFNQTQYRLEDRMTINGVISNDGTPLKARVIFAKIFDSQGVLRQTKTLTSNREGVFVWENINLSNYNIGLGEIKLYKDGELALSKTFTIVDQNNGSGGVFNLNKESFNIGEVIRFNGEYYNDGAPIAAEEVVVSLYKGETLITTKVVTTDDKGKFADEINAPGLSYEGTCELKALCNGILLSQSFELVPVLTSIQITNLVSSMPSDRSHQLKVLAWYGAQSSKDITNDPELQYQSSNQDVATVEQGLINTKAVGETQISVDYKQYEDQFTLTVDDSDYRWVDVEHENYKPNQVVKVFVNYSDMNNSGHSAYLAKLLSGGQVVRVFSGKLDKQGKTTIEYKIPSSNVLGDMVFEVSVNGKTHSDYFMINDHLLSTLYTDQTSYSLGDTVKYSGILKDSQGSVVPNGEASLKLLKGDVTIKKWLGIQADEAGKFEGKYVLGKELEPGKYTFVLKDNHHTVNKVIVVKGAQTKKIELDKSVDKIKLGQTMTLKVYATNTLGEKRMLTEDDAVDFSATPLGLVLFTGNGVISASGTGTVQIKAVYEGYSDSFTLTIEKQKPNDDDDPSGGNSSPSNPSSSSSSNSNSEPTKIRKIPTKISKTLEEVLTAMSAKDATSTKIATDFITQIKDLEEEIKGSSAGDLIVIQLHKQISDIAENLTVTDTLSMVETLNDLAIEVVDSGQITSAQANTMFKVLLKGVAGDLMKHHKNQNDLVKIKGQFKTIATIMVENKSVLMILENNTPASAMDSGSEQYEIELGYNQIKSAIKKAKDVITQITSNYNRYNLSGLNKLTTPSIKVEVEDKNKSAVVTLDEETLGLIKTSKVDIRLIRGNLEFFIPNALMDDTKEKMSVRIESLENQKQQVYTLGNGGQVKLLESFDLDLIFDGISFKDNGLSQLVVAVDTGNLKSEIEDTKQLVVKVKTDGQWASVDFEVDDHKITFYPKHFSEYAVMLYEPEFEDIAKHWSADNIVQLAAQGIINGRDNLTFDPDGLVTRAEFAKILVELLDLSGEVSRNYNDIEQTTWYYDYVGIAGMNSLIPAVIDGNFRPNDYITREEMAVAIGRAYKVLYGLPLEGETEPFSDDSMISDYAREAVYAAKYNRLLSGYPDGSFKPQNTATRGEAAKILVNLLQP